MRIITLSIGRNILKADSRERTRMHLYAQCADSLHIVMLTRTTHGFSEEIHEGNLHIYPTNSSSQLLMLSDAYRIAKRIADTPDSTETVVSSQDPFEMGFVSYHVAQASGAQFHVQVHGDYFSPYWEEGSWLRSIKRTLARFLLLRAPRIRVVSERIKYSLIERGIPESRITVLPIRPELETFLKSEHHTRNDGTFIFLAMSRFSSEKNISRIITAFAQVYAAHSHTRLRLVGDGPEKEHIEKDIHDLKLEKVVSVSPWTEDAAREMSEADIFLLASRHEAYGLTLVEAMASELPIVTTDVGCVGEVVKDGVHGIVVSEDGSHVYAEAMRRLVSDDVLRMSYGKSGRETAKRLAETTPEEYAKAWVAALSA